ncbi:MAG: hypothetical protein ABJC12_01535 [Saprospiraceae bacterium]
MKKTIALEPILFYAFLALLLIPVWSMHFFVTGDGPCHLHNSKILLDYWMDHGKDFYDPFYYLNHDYNPNWLYTLITVPLLEMFNSFWTEKIFFTLYVLGFGLGIRYLIIGINPKASFISSLGLIFCFHNLVIKGFFNNSLSFVMWFWVAGWWWRNKDDFRTRTLLINAILILGLYSTHPLGLIFGMMMIGSMLLGLWYAELREKGGKESLNLFFKRIKALLLSSLPALILFAEYMSRSNMTPDTTVHRVKDSLDFILHLYSLVNVQSSEDVFALLASVSCILLFLTAIVIRLRQRKWQSTDGLLLFLIAAVICILFPPSKIGGGLEISYRMAIIPFLAMLFWSATADFPNWIKIITQVAALAIGIGFLSIRLPIQLKASEYAQEIYSCDSLIQNKSTIFVLNYDWEGHTPDGQLIADRAGLFSHVDCYLGTDKSLIISDNYEAHFYYFPVIVRWQTNMYSQTDKEGINFDNRPPRADIVNYKKRTGEDIDYVLMLGYRDEYKDNPYTAEIFTQLDSDFSKVYTSQFGRAVLYKSKK